jgi:hypothetical protein
MELVEVKMGISTSISHVRVVYYELLSKALISEIM